MKTEPRSDAELNRIIAEWMGWLKMIRMGKEVYYDPEGGHVLPNELPSYCTDLNAMHDAEKKLTDNQHSNFQWLLFESAYNGSNSQTAERMCVSATARQRAEALVKVIEGGAK